MHSCEDWFERHAVYFAMSNLLPKMLPQSRRSDKLLVLLPTSQSLLALGCMSEIGSPRESSLNATGSAFASSLLILVSSLHCNRSQVLLGVAASVNAVLIA